MLGADGVGLVLCFPTLSSKTDERMGHPFSCRVGDGRFAFALSLAAKTKAPSPEGTQAGHPELSQRNKRATAGPSTPSRCALGRSG
jgi:hypothetical protein